MPTYTQQNIFQKQKCNIFSEKCINSTHILQERQKKFLQTEGK